MRRRFVRIFISSILLLMSFTVFVFSYHLTHADDPIATPVVAVHGINAGPGLWGTAVNGDNTMPNCKLYWREIKSYLQHRLGSDFRQVGYYQHDCPDNGSNTAMSGDLHDKLYASHCTSFWDGNDGNNNENLNHLACLLGWYLYDNFGQYHSEEILIGHSMGGLLIRRTLELVQQHDQHMPSAIGHIKQVFDFNTPQSGHFMAGLMCGLCGQGWQMSWLSSFMLDLEAHGQSPQAGGSTAWILIGGSCDTLVGMRALRMHANQYYWYTTSPCYDHGGALHDTTWANVSIITVCDAATLASNACTIDLFGNMIGAAWHTIKAAPHSVKLLYDLISGTPL